MTIVLKDADDQEVIVDQAESCNIVGTLSFGSTSFVKSDLVTLTLTLYNEKTAEIINSRDEQNILDANGSSVATDGTVTIELDPLDNVIVDTTNVPVNTVEVHIARVEWTWDDGTGDDRTGREEYSFKVRRLPSPT